MEPAAGGGGWGSWWSTATTAVQAAQKIADEGYKKVRAEGVGGLEGVKVGGVDLGSLKKGAEERLKGTQGIQIQGLDLDKLRECTCYFACVQLLRRISCSVYCEPWSWEASELDHERDIKRLHSRCAVPDAYTPVVCLHFRSLSMLAHTHMI